jgi:hypothetical protein
MASQFDSPAGEPELTFPEAINLATRRMATALVIAGLAVGLGLYFKTSEPRYQAFATPNGIVRLNTSSGTVILCQADRKCGIVLRKGQHLEGGHDFSFGFSDKPPAIAPPTAPSAPAPQAAPAAPAPPAAK